MKNASKLVLLALWSIVFTNCTNNKPKVLVFTKSKGYHHESIPAGAAAIIKLGEEHQFNVDTTSDATYFNDDKLKKYSAVVFLSTTGNILNSDQKVALQRYIEAGGGFVGIHAAADAEYNWPWYNKLVGAYFMSHPGDPNVRKANVIVTDTTNPASKGLPQTWERTDEWYNYKSISPAIKVIAKLDEDSYEGGENGDNHPIAWYQDFDGGRSFYTGGGHTAESFSEPLFLQHLAGGIQYAMGNGVKLDYAKSYATKAPEENRFNKVILSNDLNEPMELAVAHDGRVFFAERSGKFYMYDPTNNSTKVLYNFQVLPDTKTAFGNGVLGMTIDPDFDTNNFVYVFYSPNKTPARQNISRFKIIGRDSLDVSSEKVLIEVPIDLEVSAHTGGSLAWDKDKNLFISTGDNTVPFASDGYAPIDETPGRLTYDAQRSASNTNDLRGKVLRIHPEPNGTYTIPDGNLFAKGTADTKPEIYTMGCRNPYRISVDQATSILYWGEVGPDAGEDGDKGPRGYDEINQAKKPGNYGWPYFVGDSKAYPRYDFVTKVISEKFDAKAPANNSVYNTGLKTLPPTTSAMIWYPYAYYDQFPDLAQGGRCAIAGPVYHYNKDKHNKIGLPEYYDKALFIADWMRNWVFAVRLDENNNYKRMEPFMPLTGNFKRPIDFEITPDGVMYMLEYGSVYGADNDDARLVRLEFNGGNRAPVAAIKTKDSIGLAPLKVKLDGSSSSDNDEDDELTYEWNFGDGSATSKEVAPEHQYTKNGVYKATLTVTDPKGEKNTQSIDIKVGNTLAAVNVQVASNSTFYFPGQPINYDVAVTDKEDQTIDQQKIIVDLKYVPKEAASFSVLGHQQPGTVIVSPGKALMDGSDCKACHTLNEKSVGPAFMEVSKRYSGKPGEADRLVNKIISGGAGVWGDHAMSAHPQLSKENTRKIVDYILSLSSQKSYDSLPAKGSVALKADDAKTGGSYVLSASYTDQGNGIVPLTAHNQVVLRPARVQAEDADVLHNINRSREQLGAIHNKSYFVLKNIDLKDIKQLTYRYSSKEIAATLEVHVGSAKGPVISTLDYKATGDWQKFVEVTAPVKDPGGKNDLYFVFKKDTPPNQHMFTLDWVEFKK
ncbi:ThuA domain-containing protein [Danxiaibacter flavus]|uniref:ThuA domain-containing protein n=1 Tax=Danxiaibacter flavus TaxID=3049108 RepID=A0ABV3ZF89_9BACT|nr:ThuA domain-containing protein [Chitinophagaceae bacterium DXS]